MGVFIFIFILLMFQALRLTEFVLVHGVSLKMALEIMLYLSVSFLPVIFPMSLLFAVLLTYGRLSADSEITALKALGLHTGHLSVPALLLAALTALASAQTSFYLAPWGNRQFEVLISDLSQLKASATIKEGVFSEGFFNLVVYATEVDEKAGRLFNVFIYDERDANAPFTIIAKAGEVITRTTRAGHSALLRLLDGNIHRSNEETYTKIDFQSYDISLFDPAQLQEKQKSFPSFNIEEIRSTLKNPELKGVERVKYEIEFHRRIALAVACLVFGLLGVALGTNTNRRAGKSGGLVLCIGILIAFWMGYVGAESLAKSETLPAWLSIWSINFVFGGFALWRLRKLPN